MRACCVSAPSRPGGGGGRASEPEEAWPAPRGFQPVLRAPSHSQHGQPGYGDLRGERVCTGVY